MMVLTLLMPSLKPSFHQELTKKPSTLLSIPLMKYQLKKPLLSKKKNPSKLKKLKKKKPPPTLLKKLKHTSKLSSKLSIPPDTLMTKFKNSLIPLSPLLLMMELISLMLLLRHSFHQELMKKPSTSLLIPLMKSQLKKLLLLKKNHSK